ncbi:Tetraspanin family protein [Melia azedarach]|uniref:Tetraspanin family protein n=1 Tax=Melia azedarach TaxID=155640 RepID=A0ACC1XPP2_MELAZ|nr:Tetraspanin family protein [Melia azedarach]
MARLSNALFIVLNFLSFVLGFTAVSCSAYIQLHGGSSVCQKALEMPLLVIGLFLMIVSTIGLVGSCCRANLLLWLYLFVMFFLIVGLLLFTVFVLVVTNNMIGKRASPDRLHDYSTWLQNRFADGKNWEEIKGCLIDTQSGCCKPPMYCGLTRENGSTWTVPEKGPAVQESDCTTFSNEQDQLCYDCKSCKGGVLDHVRKEWRFLSVLNSCVLVVILVVFCIGCCVRKNYRYDQYMRYRNGYAHS